MFRIALVSLAATACTQAEPPPAKPAPAEVAEPAPASATKVSITYCIP